MKKSTVSQSAVEGLGYYVYLLVDPRDKKIFYIGKGKNRRVSSHVENYNKKEAEKNRIIREIIDSGNEVKIEIARHGLTEKEAFEVEASLIDLLGIGNLTNIVSGHDSGDRGRMSLTEVEIKFGAKKPDFKHDLILININKLFNSEMKPLEILNVTKGNWRIGLTKANNYKFACAVCKGIVREVFEINKWMESSQQGRKCFEGKIAENEIRNRYLYSDVSDYKSQNPIMYSDSKK